jgi:non-specific serine/threonine protein kinase/serine/threonine-protein kinase
VSTDDSDLIEAARRESEQAQPAEGPPAGIFPGYHVVRAIHHGAQGIVYEAVRESTGHSVAIKVMREGPHAGASNRARFEREAQILAQLRHPNIVSIHDTGSSAGCFFFVMDYIEGWALDDYLESHPLSVPQKLELFVTICDALNAAHLHGVIHRDLKPGNILIDEQGEPHLLDFGLAKVEEQGDRAMTMSGQFLGSLPWSSPEQADGSSNRVDVRTDVYALGVILYQMLTGRFPYDVTGRLPEVIERIRTVDPRRPRTFERSIDDELETIVLTCLAKEPERRYQTAGELARDLRAYRDGDPIQAKRDSTLYVLRKHLRRHRAAVAVAASFLLVLTAGLVTSLTFWQKAERLVDQLRVAQAETEAARQLAEREAFDAHRYNDFFEDVIGTLGGDASTAMVAPLVQEVPAGSLPPLSVAELLDLSLDKVDDTFADDPRLEASARATIGRGLRGLGRYDEARRELQVAWETTRRTLGEQHEETLRIAADLGQVVVCVGDAETGEALLRPVVTCLEDKVGPAEPVTLQARRALGNALAAQGRVDEGVQLLLDVHETARRELGEVDEQTLRTAIDPAIWMWSSGEEAQARVMLRDSADKARTALGPRHFVTVLSDAALNRIVLTSSELPELGGIGQPFELDVARVAFAAPDPWTLRLEIGPLPSDGGHRALIERGRESWLLGQQAEMTGPAEQAARAAWNEALASLGPQHLDTLLLQQTLGGLLLRDGRIDEGELHLRRACSGLIEAVGHGHALTQQAIHQLVRHAATQGDVSTVTTWSVRLHPETPVDAR